jgi:hemolysin D
MQDGLFGGTVMSIDRDAEAAPVNANGVQGATRQADEIDRVEASERLRYTVHTAIAPGSLDVDGKPAALLLGMSAKAKSLPASAASSISCWRRYASMSTHAMRERS